MFVLQEWVSNVGLKMQSILISGLRAPDASTYTVKKCVRWLRARCQIDADPAKQSYMESVIMDQAMILMAMEELEYLPCHYVHHFADAFAVVAYHHPEETVKAICYKVHFTIAEEIFHFKPETKEEFLERHKDKLVDQVLASKPIAHMALWCDHCKAVLFRPIGASGCLICRNECKRFATSLEIAEHSAALRQ